MRVVRHAMNRQEFLAPFPDDPGNEFMKLLLALLAYKILSGFDRENDLNVDL